MSAKQDRILFNVLKLPYVYHGNFRGAFPASDVNTCFDSGQSVVSTCTKSSIGTSTHPFFSGFFHSKMAQNAPEFTSERLKSMGKLWPDH